MTTDIYPVRYKNQKPPKTDWLLIIGIVIAAVVLGACFGCSHYTPQKATEAVQKANNKQPATVAALVRVLYPCTTTKADTITSTRDSLVYIPCPDSVTIVTEAGATDTLWHIRKVPVQLPVHTVTVTKTIEDSAKIKVLQSQLETTQAKYEATNAAYVKKVAECDAWQHKARTRWWWLIGIAIVVVGTVALKIYSKLKPGVKL